MTAQALRDERRSSRSAEPSTRAGLVLAVVVTCQLMIVLDATVVNVALPPIREDLGFSATGLSWVMNAYTLAFGGLLLLGGRLRGATVPEAFSTGVADAFVAGTAFAVDALRLVVFAMRPPRRVAVTPPGEVSVPEPGAP